MGQIEPELLRANIPLLPEKYKDELPEQREVRRMRYAEAYHKYDEALQAYVAETELQIQKYKREAMQSLEKKNRSQDEESILQQVNAALLAT